MRIKVRAPILVLFLLAAGQIVATGTAPTFQALNFIQPNQSFYSQESERPSAAVTAISADGSTIVGDGYNSKYSLSACKWVNGAVTFLPLVPTNVVWQATAVSSDGSVIVGNGGGHPVRYASGAAVSLGLATGVTSATAMAVSADGTTVSGLASISGTNYVYRWTGANGMQVLAFPAGIVSALSFGGMSSDGQVCVANVEYTSGYSHVCRWDGTGTPALLEQPSEDPYASAAAVSADGSIVAGSITGATESACIWSGTSLTILPTPGNGGSAVADSISADGSKVVGYDDTLAQAVLWSDTAPQVIGAFSSPRISADGQSVIGSLVEADRRDVAIWDATNGLRSLSDLLGEQPVIPALGPDQQALAVGVTDTNGTLFIAGRANCPDTTGKTGFNDGWLATVPAGPAPDPFAGTLLDASPGFKPSFKVTESYKDAIEVFFVPPDQGIPGFYDSETNAHYSSAMSMSLSMAGVDPASLTGTTPIQFIFGDFAFSKTLGQDPSFSPGKTSVSYTFDRLIGGADTGRMTVKCSWTATRLTVTADISLVESDNGDLGYSRLYTPGFGVPSYISSDVPAVSGDFWLKFRFGSRAGERLIPVKAKATTKSVMSNGEDLQVADVSFSAAADYVRPSVRILSPAPKSILLPPQVPLTLSAAGGGVIDQVLVNVNGAGFVPATQSGLQWTFPLLLKDGTNTVQVQSFDSSGVGSAIANATYTHLQSAGTYTAILTDTGGQPHGIVSITIAGDSGLFSGKLSIDGKSHSVRGQLAMDGTDNVTIPQAGSAPIDLSLSLAVDGTANSLTGTLTSGTSLDLTFAAARVIYTKSAPYSPFADSYTLLIPPLGTPNTPGGYGFGTLTVDSVGAARLVLVLADGTRLSYGGSIDGLGNLPIYLRPYRTGLFAGLLQFSQQSDSDCDGTMYWTKPAAANALYPLGFSGTTNAIGSISGYLNAAIFPTTNPNAQFVFSGGDLASPYTVPFQGFSVSGTAPAGFAVSFGDYTGSGKFLDPTTGTSRNFQFALYPPLNEAFGFFLDKKDAGLVEFYALP